MATTDGVTEFKEERMQGTRVDGTWKQKWLSVFTLPLQAFDEVTEARKQLAGLDHLQLLRQMQMKQSSVQDRTAAGTSRWWC